MPTILVSPVLHRRALDAVGDLLADLAPTDLDRPSPCAGWDLRQLLAHMIGQNHGFADAAERDVGIEAFADRPVGTDVGSAWADSAARVHDGLAAAVAAGDRTVLLAEFAGYGRLPATIVLGMHLLDTVVHGWDVATALGQVYRPDDDLVAATLERARFVPTGAARERAGAAFAPVVEEAVLEKAAVDEAAGDPWERTLRLLGRRP